MPSEINQINIAQQISLLQKIKIIFKKTAPTRLIAKNIAIKYMAAITDSGVCPCRDYTIPCAIIASATFKNPAMFAPTTRFPSKPYLFAASADFL